jgi:polar amino acid transport system substrate-binding protein
MRLYAVCFTSIVALAAGVAAHAETLTVLAGPIEPYAIETGSRPGAAVEVVREMAKRAGLEVNFKFEAWARAQQDAREGHDLAIIPLTRTTEREPLYSWIAPILSDPFYLQTNRKEVDVASVDAAKGLSIGVLRGADGEADLKSAGIAGTSAGVDEDTNAKMLKAGRIDAWYARGMVASATYAKAGGDPKELKRGAEKATAPMYLGGSPGFSPELAAKLAKAFEAMKADGSYDRIVKSYQ